jgi:ABC-type Fe3+ transport system substrate-binding protein
VQRLVGRLLLLAIFMVLVGVPIVLRPTDGGATASSGDARRLVVFTPHNENIRREFGDAFARWHRATYGEEAVVAWSAPGGTSEIRKMLEAAYKADLVREAETGEPIGGMGDVLFGGGSFEFTQLSKPIVATTVAGERSTTVLAPIEWPTEFLDASYGGATEIGGVPLFDPKGMWFGAALSGFGIVYNRDLLLELGLPEPEHWADLCDPRLDGWVALVNPAQSGSVATAYEAILQRRGWNEGWRILRRMAANARTFSASAPKAPTDVSLGEAAMGVCIDFFGRYQSQAIVDAGRALQGASGTTGDPSRPARVGYIDPEGETVIDPDPVAMLRGARDPELARRFVEFVLSREGQALWQFRPEDRARDGLGPERYELRRMPVRRSMYASDDFTRFVDQVDPWTIARAVENPNPSFRPFLASLFVAMAIENRRGLEAAWDAIHSHPAYAAAAAKARDGIVTADDTDDPTLRAMLVAFDALPTVPGPDGAVFDLSDESVLGVVREGWLRRGWKDAGLWRDDAAPAEVLRSRFTEFFRDRYDAVLELRAKGGS